ncbi:MAG: bacillithiol system redox-active protein YtxJ, partial [Saprospiraceae bacterium]
MFWNKSKTENTSTAYIDWQLLNTAEGIEAIKEKSTEKPQVIFKHSTRCSISSMAKRRLERNWNIDESKVDIYYLDLIAYRSISNLVSSDFGVTHQSPQILIIKNKEAVFHTSHNDIS